MSETEQVPLNRRLTRYASAPAAIVGAFLWRLAMERYLGPGLPTYVTFYPAVMAVAILAGLWPGVLATLLGALLAGFWILPPQGQFRVERTSDAVGLAIFSLMGVSLSFLAEGYRRNRQKAAAYDKELALRESHERLRVTLASIGDAVLTTDSHERVTFLNPVAEALTGWKAEGAWGQPIQSVFQVINEQTRISAENIVTRVLEAGRIVELANHTALVAKGGREVPIEDSAAPILDAGGKVIGVVLVFHDVTEKRHKDEQLLRLNRTLKALSNSNRALLHATTEEALLQQVCKIVTEDCGHAMVWIGFAEDDEQKTVRPVADAGFEEGYLESLRITWADTERGHGPTGTAIRTGQPNWCRNMLTDPKFEPWRAEAIKRGYASSLVLPLMEDGKAFGATESMSVAAG